MKKIIKYALLLTLCLYAGTSWALDWFPAQEMREEEESAIRNATGVWKIPDGIAEFGWDGRNLVLIMEDGTIGVYGSGSQKSEIVSIKSKVFTSESYMNSLVPDDTLNESVQKPRLKDTEVLDSLVAGLNSRLSSMRFDNKGHDYGEIDSFFYEALGILRKINWADTSTDYHVSGDAERISWLSAYRRYAMPLIETLSQLFEKHPENKQLSVILNWAIEYAVESKDPPMDETLTSQQRRSLGEKLFELAKAHPDKFYLYSSARTVLKVVAPDLVQKFDDLDKSRRNN